jgi:hypothetical protein
MSIPFANAETNETPIVRTSQVKLQTHPLICQYTGLTLGRIELITVAGHVPFLSQWKNTQVIHPLFSLDLGALLSFAKNSWNNFCSLTPEESANAQFTERQEKILQVTALAILHNIADVQQTTQWLPTIQEVSGCWSSLIQLAYWKSYLESNRFRFPALRISKFNKGIELQPYLQNCWKVKKDYESKVREAVELEKLESAERALVALRNDLVTKAPRSKKLLWRWFLAHIPQRYARDTEGWMWELFDAETEQEIQEFTIADIDLFEEIVLCEIPTGSSVSHAFLERIAYKRKVLTNRFQTFEILVPEMVRLEKEAGTISMTEPRLVDYPSKIKWMVAHAKWRLAHTDTEKHRREAMNQQDTVTVNASHIPDIGLLLGSTQDDEEDDAGPLFDRSSSHGILDTEGDNDE